MYIAIIGGWDQVAAIAETEDQAKELVIAEKQRLYPNDLEEWSWESVEEYYGAYTEKVTNGKVFHI